MDLWVYLVAGAMLVLAMWKVYDLIFGVMKKSKLQATKTVTLMNIFFAEFTYKTMKQQQTYTPAPPDVYKWLDLNFQEWAESYKKRNGLTDSKS